jgi:hypothetical protein
MRCSSFCRFALSNAGSALSPLRHFCVYFLAGGVQGALKKKQGEKRTYFCPLPLTF